MENNITLQEIAEKIKEASSILIFMHRRPDGDTVGSAYGIKYAFPEKQIYCLCADDIPTRLQFISKAPYESCPEDFEPELIMAVDTASPGLLGRFADEYIDIKIDHHETSENYAEYNYTDPTAAATGEIVYSILKICGVMTPEAANAIYSAISSDTGGFRYSNTTANTLRIAADLCEAGADMAECCHMLFESRTQAEVRALSAVYANIRYFENGGVAVVNLTNEIKKRYNITDDDVGEISSIPREIEGVELAVTIRQLSNSPDRYKISMRSGRYVDVDKICALFGGGGHSRAAGAEISAQNPQQAERTVLKYAIDAYRNSIKQKEDS
ncbi:MAG TPA: bifunctional oligoribonuclease/PAP phosphatase NrnA [Clostridiales bacterium]|nr:bifunctional oligoribonuclease/PAP phosphatase NrnA [Clostridiales bacterium]